MSLSYKLLKTYNSLLINHKTISFFTKNQTRYFIWLLSVTRFDEPVIKNFNFFYKNIPDSISSKVNINNQIDLALENNFLEKKKSDIDKRSTIITATKITMDEFEIYRKNLNIKI